MVSTGLPRRVAFVDYLQVRRFVAIDPPISSLIGKEGLLVAFAANRINRVTPVTYGERLTIATWFY